MSEFMHEVIRNLSTSLCLHYGWWCGSLYYPGEDINALVIWTTCVTPGTADQRMSNGTSFAKDWGSLSGVLCLHSTAIFRDLIPKRRASKRFDGAIHLVEVSDARVHWT